MAKRKKDLPYRPCVGIMLLNSRGEVFIGRRSKDRVADGADGHLWQMPQGGIDKGESVVEAARRELEEETGITAVRVLEVTDEWLLYDLPPHLIGIALKGKYRGQKQKWVAMRFLGNDNEIRLEAAEHDEFSDWRWTPVEQIVELVVPFKREVYEKVVDAFRHLANSPS